MLEIQALNQSLVSEPIVDLYTKTIERLEFVCEHSQIDIENSELGSRSFSALMYK